ncbi:MAG: 1-acyl-sn-glycerol-3-phosphate acyltransferase [Actinomycetota bacterium]|nr:1-acyl-sn-glycerol-3-phosphate acyltransferase [Actinomycetota bacterium]
MSTALSSAGAPARGASRPPSTWARRPWACALRAVLQSGLLFPVVRWLCRPLVVAGQHRLGDEPVIFVANHRSHADTALLLAALPRSVRDRTAPAAAEDYFFAGRAKGILVPLLTGAFPFPRRGPEGLSRVAGTLEQGWSVVMFPEGTRSVEGRLGSFKKGVGILATQGATVVPVGIAGQGDVLPKGARIPRQAPVAVVFGAPVRFDPAESPAAVAADLESRVRELVDDASARRSAPRTTWFHRAHALACSRAALVLAFAWGVAEAIAWPLVPDFLIAPLAFAAPRRAGWVIAAALAGTLAGGAAAFALGPTELGITLLDHAPLVTDRMVEEARSWLGADGARALSSQPMSGIPYKVFAYQAALESALAPFLWFSGLARAIRFAVVGALFAGGGRVLARWRPTFFGVGLIAYAITFAAGLAAVVTEWR